MIVSFRLQIRINSTHVVLGDAQHSANRLDILINNHQRLENYSPPHQSEIYQSACVRRVACGRDQKVYTYIY